MCLTERGEKLGARGGILGLRRGWGVLYFPDLFWFFFAAITPG